MQILTNTPVWVWVLLAALIGLGLAQVPDRRVHPMVVLILPLAVTASAAFGLLAAFGPDPSVAWTAAAAAIAGFAINALVLRTPRGAVWDSAARQFAVPGSWLPLALILLIFGCRFAVGVARVTQPKLAENAAFMTGITGLMAFAAGIFVSRAAMVLATRRAVSA